MSDFLISEGRIIDPESINLEFKRCKERLPKDFWPTYSSFANTFGGTLILGVEDITHNIEGVDDPESIIKDLWDLLNNDTKVSVNLLTEDDIKIREMDGKKIIIINIPRAERRKRPVFINNTMKNGTYKRNGEGDYHCSVSELS